MAYYDEIAGGYEELHKEEQQKKLEIAKKYIHPKKEDWLLDVGCGSGLSSMWECNVIGIDPCFELLKRNKKEKVAGVAEKMPFRGKTFDFVVSLTALQNFNNIEEGLKEIKRVGKGVFAVSFLKKSEKKDAITEMIKKHFNVKDAVEEEKDIVMILNSNS